MNELVRGGQIEGDDTNAFAGDEGFEFFPVGGVEAADAVDLFDEEDVPALGDVEESEEFGTFEGRATFIFKKPGGDFLSVGEDELDEGFLRPVGVLLGCAGAEVGIYSHTVQYRWFFGVGTV